MGLNVSTSMTFENREFLRSTAKQILTKKGASQEMSSKIAQAVIFDNSELYSNEQLNALKAYAQIMINGGLKETKKYLNNQKKINNNKKYILGELWETIEKSTENDFDD